MMGIAASHAAGGGAQSALERVRQLTPPSPEALYGGENEGVEFWEDNEALLKEALRELGPLHPYVYNPTPQQAFTPSVAAALSSSSSSLLSLLQTTSVPGVYSLDLLNPSFCQDLIEELAHVRASGIPLRRPNGMNRYGAILGDLGFESGLMKLLGDSVLAPIAKAVFQGWIRDPELSERYAFTVRYEHGGDLSLAEHADASCVTLNVCLGHQSGGAATFEGGDLLFRGVRFQQDNADKMPQQAVKHRLGLALIHLGQHLHQASEITAGVRENLILWMMGDHGWVRIRPYDTYSEPLVLPSRLRVPSPADTYSLPSAAEL